MSDLVCTISSGRVEPKLVPDTVVAIAIEIHDMTSNKVCSRQDFCFVASYSRTYFGNPYSDQDD